jgi:hypothetical protein
MHALVSAPLSLETEVVRANLPGSNAPILTMTGLGIPVMTSVVAMVIWMIAFHRRFRVLPDSPLA